MRESYDSDPSEWVSARSTRKYVYKFSFTEKKD